MHDDDRAIVRPVVTQWADFERRSGGLTDTLTGLPNYRAFMNAMTTLLACEQNGHAMLVLLDLDDMVTFNDERGRDDGDAVLTEFTRQLAKRFPDCAAFRVGGDEFALVTSVTASDVLERVNRFCFEVRLHMDGVTASAGLVHLFGRFEHPADICAQAKCAMREAKNRGRANAVAFEDIRERSWLISSEQSRALRRLLSERAVEPVFQLIWDMRSNAPLGFEALSRPDARYGFAGPQEAFDFAEKLGIAHELDALCHSKVLAAGAQLDFEGLLFLNVSPQSLTRDFDALARFAETLSSDGMPPERVVLEITERSNVPPVTIALAATRLRALGFRIALDDTGAGNSGLEILSQLQVDYLKIDRGVIEKACTDRIARGVLIGMVAIATENGSCVIAEGIENDIMLDLVRGIGGIDAVQGYLFGRPSRLPVATLEPGARSLLQES